MKQPIFKYLVCLVVAGIASTACAAKNPALNPAIQAIASGDWEVAVGFAQQAVVVDPEDDEAWTLLARAEAVLGDTVQAVEHFEKAVELNSKNPRAVLELTSLYINLNRVGDAEAVVAEAERRDPKGKIDEFKAARALILGKQGDLQAATPILASLTAKNTGNSLYPMMLARLYENAKVHTLAASNYEQAWNLDQGNPQIAFEYGQVLLTLKEYDKADKLFEVVQQKDPDNETVDYLRGLLYYAAKRYGEAATQLQKAAEKRPDHFRTNFLLGASYLELSKSGEVNAYSLAEVPLRKALELEPDREDVAQKLAECLYYQGKTDYQLALRDSVKTRADSLFLSSIAKTIEALAYYPHLPEANAQIARAFDKMGNLDSSLNYTDRELEVKLLQFESFADEFEKEMAEFEQRMEEWEAGGTVGTPPVPPQPPIPPEATDEMSADITRKVSLLQRMKDQKGLAEFLNPLIEDTAIFDKYGMILANAYFETEDYAQARETLNKILANDPGNCDAHQLNAYIDLKRERYADAIPVLQAGVRYCPKNCDLWVYLGDSYFFANEKSKESVTKAQEAYAEAKKLGCAAGKEKHDQIKQILAAWR